MQNPLVVQQGCRVVAQNADNPDETVEGISDENGNVTLRFTLPGRYQVTVVECAEDKLFVAPNLTVKVNKREDLPDITPVKPLPKPDQNNKDQLENPQQIQQIESEDSAPSTGDNAVYIICTFLSLLALSCVLYRQRVHK